MPFFQTFALTAGASVLGLVENCPGELSGLNMFGRKCPGSNVVHSSRH